MLIKRNTKETQKKQIIKDNNKSDKQQEGELYDDYERRNIKKCLSILLNQVCCYRGNDTVYNEIRDYIPNNEKSKYGTNLFIEVYTQEYDKQEHNTPDDLLWMFNKCKHGVCHVLTKIYQKAIKTQQNTNLYGIFKCVAQFYINNYNIIKSDTSIDRFNKKPTKINNKYPHISQYNMYKNLYICKCLYTYCGCNYICKYKENDITLTYDKHDLHYLRDNKQLLKFIDSNNFIIPLRELTDKEFNFWFSNPDWSSGNGGDNSSE